MTRGIGCLATSMAVALFPVPALAQDEGAIGLDVDVEIASAFVFRGINLFGEEQRDQRASVFPSITVSAGAVSGGYWGAYQLSGDNARQKLDDGFSAENDLWVSYEGAVDELGYSASLTYYTFPFADEARAGAATPMYLEPNLGVSHSTDVELGFNVSYFGGLQDATQSLSYLYLSPSVTKTIRLTSSVELSLGGTSGYKLWTNDPDAEDNTYDVQLDVGLNIQFGGAHVTPAVHVAWTNLADAGFGGELVVWAGIQLGGSAPEI